MGFLNEVYGCDGERLGCEYVNLSGLQNDTKEAILQMMYLDETVDVLSDQVDEYANANK